MDYPPYVAENNPEPVPIPPRNTPILSNALLQQFIYYNAIYYIPYAIINIALATFKYRNYSEWRASYVTPVIVALFTGIEPCRLYLAYRGNLMEQVPLLLAFIFLTFFFCAIYLFYFLAMQYPLLPLDRAMGIVQAVFCAFEFVLAIYTVKSMVSYKTEQFRLRRFTWRDVDEQGQPLERIPLTRTSDPGAYRDEYDLNATVIDGGNDGVLYEGLVAGSADFDVRRRKNE